jgi:alpha-glucosidase
MEKYMMNQWKELIDSQVSRQYVNPLYPKSDEDVTFSIKITTEVKNVYLFINIEGQNKQYECTIKDEIASSTVKLKNGEMSLYYFVVIAKNTYFYFSQKGLTSYIPGYKDCFEIIPDYNPPSWVSSATCYQVFPDRFRDGDPSLDVKDGEYYFDGGVVKNMSIDDIPLQFEEGKCLDFFGGDFKGIIDSIKHFKELNINALYLNPIGVSCTTHRYDCCDFFTIDPKLGGDEMFIEMVNALHDNKIKIIVDISINHTGTLHPWFIKANADPTSPEANYYYIDGNGEIAFWEDVPTLPQLNYSHEVLREIMYKSTSSVMKKFLREPYHQDGWRLDVADVVGRRGKDQLTHEIWREVRKSVKEENSEAYIVGECWIDSNPYLKGDEWDGAMNYIGCGRPIRKWMGETDVFFLSGWGQNPPPDTQFTGDEMKDAIKCQLDNTRGQLRFFQMNLIDSHDTPRLHNNEYAMNHAMYKGAIYLMYLLPGMPSTYYGDEVGLRGTINTCEDWRFPMQWDESKWDMNFYNLYKALGELRNEYSLFLSFASYTFFESDESMMSFVRYDENEAIVLVLNKGNRREVEINTRFINGTKMKILLGSGNAKLRGNKIICSLEDKESLILHIN